MTSERPKEPGRNALNRDWWESNSDQYQSRHYDALQAAPLAWGPFRIPESQVQALGDTSDLDILEYGCGAAQWSIALRQTGARAVGLDFSWQQLIHARVPDGAQRVPLVQADAVATPFRAASFDVVFCDHGAMGFVSPMLSVPEVARILRPGGRFVFCMATPISDICWDPLQDKIVSHLVSDYFDMHAFPDDQMVCFQLTYGHWFRLFKDHGFVVEDLIELQPEEGAKTTYDESITLEWARRWPSEHIWCLKKTPGRT